tara:strand:- start:19853 stop:21250 length:1398 start_codon:yes stop_codon:yes gene_type:complete
MTKIKFCQNIFENQKKFFESNKISNPKKRIETLKKLKKVIIKNEEIIINALEMDLGKSYAESFMSEIAIIYNELNFFIKKTKKWSKRKRISSSLLNFFSTDFIVPIPYGVTLNISPWNYPFQLSISPIIGAVSAGNTVVLKPSEHSPNTSKVLEKIINEAFERGHVDVINGGPEIGKYLLSLKWDYIFFTGSTEIGKIVALEAAKTLTPVTLELGGKNPCIIDQNVSIETASKRVVFGKFLNCGQTCIAPNFLAIHENIKELFINSLINNIKSLYGDDPKNSPFYSNIINDYHVDRLSKLIKNSNIVYGGKFEKSIKFFEPTIIEVSSVENKILDDEIFGPILPILTYSSDEELDNILKGSKNPLAFYVFTNNKKFAKKLINKYPFGGGAINDTIGQIVNKNLPFGGIGNSGIGKYHGYESFKTFSHFKPYIVKSNIFDLNFKYKLSKESIIFKLTKKLIKYISI